jgi:hypothetical protein
MAPMRSRSCLGAALVAGLLLLVPGSAFGQIIQGTASDPVGDSSGAPSQDIVSASAQYDTNGQLTLSATMNGDIASGPASDFEFRVASFAPPASCTGVTAWMSGFSKGTEAWTALTGYPSVGGAFISVSGNTITFYASSQEYANKSFSCMEVQLRPMAGGANTLDHLNTPVWFTGSGPGSSGAGTPGGAGQCSPPTRCPGHSPTPGTANTRTPPTVLAFATVVRVKLSTGAGTLAVRCGAPAAEYCTFRLALFASVKNGRASAAAKRVNVGSVTGKVRGGAVSRLAVRLNAAGRKLLRRGPMHLEAKGSVANSAGLAAQFHKRITIKKK